MKNVAIGKRPRYFDLVISPVAVFAAGHRTLYKTDLRNFDVLFRKLIRSAFGPPAGMDWTRPWHEILHDWNGRINEFAALHGIKLRVLKHEEAHKWLGCMISAAGSRNTHLDLQHHLQAASRAFHANKWILCDKGVSILHRLRYFDKVVSPVACFGASHRAIHKHDLAKLDVEYRRLMRMVVGPPADTNWASPWHDILHGWNNRVQILSNHAGLQPWSVTCIEAVWKFASYVAILPVVDGVVGQPSYGTRSSQIFADFADGKAFNIGH